MCQFQINTALRCFNYGCQNGGTCTILNTCICLPGYFGSLCEVSSFTTTQPATTLPATISRLAFCSVAGLCQNGGTCFQVTYNTFYCNCPTGYSGVFCQFSQITTTIATTTSVLKCPTSNLNNHIC